MSLILFLAMTWSSWSDCDVACGTGQQRRRLVCSYNSCKKMKNLNATETRNCTKTVIKCYVFSSLNNAEAIVLRKKNLMC